MSLSLAWLAGILDGEGHITILKRTSYYVPSVGICNTNPVLINRVTEILDSEGIEYCVSLQERRKQANSKPAWYVMSQGKPRVLKYLGIVMPFLVAKAPQAELVLKWSLFEGRRRNLTEEDMDMVGQIRALNHRGRVR